MSGLTSVCFVKAIIALYSQVISSHLPAFFFNFVTPPLVKLGTIIVFLVGDNLRLVNS